MIEKKAKSSIIKIRRQADTEALSKMRKCHAESEISKPSQNLFHKTEVLSQLSKSWMKASQGWSVCWDLKTYFSTKWPSPGSVVSCWPSKQKIKIKIIDMILIHILSYFLDIENSDIPNFFDVALWNQNNPDFYVPPHPILYLLTFNVPYFIIIRYVSLFCE